MSRVAQVAFLFMLGASLACGRSGPEVHMTFAVVTEGAVRQDVLAQVQETVQERLDLFGFRNAEVKVSGDRLGVRVAGVENLDRVRRLIEAPSVLALRLVRFPADGQDALSKEAVLSHYNGQLPPDLEILQDKKRFYALEKQPVVTSVDFKSVRTGIDQFGQPEIEFTLNPDAASTFAQVTGDNVGYLLAIVLDGRVVSAPRINSRIHENGVIQGGFTEEEVQDLAIMLRSGPLPVRLKMVEQTMTRPNGR